jgi:hypothetical protein
MFSRLRIFAPPEFPVLSLGVQAQMPKADVRERSQFHLLVRHFLQRFFNNDIVSVDGETKARFLQVVYAIAIPGMVVALFLFPLYHAPLPRPFWSQASDHYFYVLYSFVVVGAMSIFAWDLLFPDLLDLFVLSSLPIVDRRLFLSRIVAACLFLGAFLLGTCALGAIFYPLLSEVPGLGRQLFAHLVAVLCSGAFAGGFFLSLQGLMETGLGNRFFRTISPLRTRNLHDGAFDHPLPVPSYVPIPSGINGLTRCSILSPVLVPRNIRGYSGRIFVVAHFQRACENRLGGNGGSPFISGCLLSARLSRQNALPD